MSLRDEKGPITCDEIFAKYRDELLALLRWDICQGGMFMLPYDNAEDYLHDFYIAFKRRDRLRKWNPDTCPLSMFMMRTWEWFRPNLLYTWRGTGKNREATPMSVTSVDWIDNCVTPTHFTEWQCHGPDTTASDLAWSFEKEELRNRMPDARYRSVFDGICQDRYQDEIAEELDEFPVTICHIKSSIQDLCSGKDWRYIEKQPSKQRTGYVQRNETRNIVGKIHPGRKGCAQYG